VCVWGVGAVVVLLGASQLLDGIWSGELALVRRVGCGVEDQVIRIQCDFAKAKVLLVF
jgi:hypothetical protein